ncbi:MAG: DUF3486 family protein [Treponemataceae bacterium]
MARKSNVELEGLLERAVDLHENEHMTIKEIADLFQSEGFSVSASGVQRALRAKKISEKEFRKKIEAAEVFVEATKNTPGLQMAKAGTDLAMSMLLTELQGMENLGTLTDGEIIDKLARVVNAQKTIAKLTLDYEKGYKQGLFKAREELDKAVKSGGVSEPTAEKIKEALGVR